MTIINGYATAQQFKDYARITSADSGNDDSQIDDIVQDASRDVDTACNRAFFAYTATRLLDCPGPDDDPFELRLTEDLLSATTILNGDGSVVDPSTYVMYPEKWPSKYKLRIKYNSGFWWRPDNGGNTVQVISVAGSWGFVDRTAVDPVSQRIISATHRASLIIAKNIYNKRFGQGVEGNAMVTGAGVVIMPNGLPKDAWDRIKEYMRR